MNSRYNLKDIGLWLGVALLLVGALYLTYSFTISAPILAIVWIFWCIFSAGLAFFTTQGAKAFRFASDAKIELLKVVWPNRQETIQKTTIVMAMVIVTSIILWGIDTSMMWVIAKITHLG